MFVAFRLMAGLECVCTEQKRATCDTPDTNYSTLLMCAMIAWYLWRELREPEENSDAPAEMYSSHRSWGDGRGAWGR